MTSYTLVKNNVKVQIQIMEDTAEMIRTVGEGVSTSKEAISPSEATRRVNNLIRQGYKAHKR